MAQLSEPFFKLPLLIPTEPTAPPKPPLLGLSLEDGFGPYNKPRKTTDGLKDGWYSTNNFYLRSAFSPNFAQWNRLNLSWSPLNLWIRSTDIFNPETSGSTLRLFTGVNATYNLIDSPSWRLRTTESMNLFYGMDINEPASKDWRSWEIGNFVALELLRKDLGLSLDIHNWYVHGLDVTIPGGKRASEDGIIVGSKLAYKLFGSGVIPLVSSASVYAQYRWWDWHVEPTGASIPWSDWHECLFGFAINIPAIK